MKLQGEWQFLGWDMWSLDNTKFCLALWPILAEPTVWNKRTHALVFSMKSRPALGALVSFYWARTMLQEKQ